MGFGNSFLRRLLPKSYSRSWALPIDIEFLTIIFFETACNSYFCKMFQQFTQRLAAELSKPLPGEDIQYRMAPVGRRRVNPNASDIEYRNSSVLILLYPHGEGISTVLIKRNEYEGAHSGQIGFPGGKQEKMDISFEATALREAEEELGIDIRQVQVLGALTNVYIPVSRFKVHPYVAVTPLRPVFNPDPFEVKDILEVDIQSFTSRNIISETTVTTSGGFKVRTPYYNLNGFIVWGATAMMISEFSAILERQERGE